MLKSLFYNIGSKLIVIACQFITLVLTNHIIGPEGRGTYLAAITWSSTFFTFSSLSISTGILNISNKDASAIKNLAYASALSAALLGIVSILLMLLLFALYPGLFNNLELKYLLLSFGAIPFMLLQQYAMAVMQVKGNFRAFNILYAAYAVTNFTAIGFMWLNKSVTVHGLIYVNLLAWVVTGCFAVYFLLPLLQRSEGFKIILKHLYKISINAHLGAVVSYIIMRTDILIVNYFTDEIQTGLYGLVVGIVQMLLIIPISIQNLLYHSLIGKTLNQQTEILLKYTRLTFVAMAVFAVVILVFSKSFVLIVGGSSFYAAIPLFKYFLPAIVFYAVPVVLAAQWNIMGVFKQINLVAFILLVISLAGNFILVPLLGIKGGGLTFLTVAVLMFTLHLYLAKKNLPHVSLSKILIPKWTDIAPFFKKSQ